MFERLRALAVLGGAGLVAGCAWSPRTQLEDCRRLSQGLQAEVARQQDVVLKLRAHNRDLAERALEDGRRLQALGEANRRYERVIADYQAERQRLIAAFDRLRNQVQAAADPVPTALRDRLHDLAAAHPGLAFDPAIPACRLAADALFRPGSDDLTPPGEALLHELAEALSGADAEGLSLTVEAPAEADDGSPDASVRRAGLSPAPTGRLGPLRALRIRAALRDHTGLDPGRIDVLAAEDGADPTPDTRRITIRFRGLAPDEPSR